MIVFQEEDTHDHHLDHCLLLLLEEDSLNHGDQLLDPLVVLLVHHTTTDMDPALLVPLEDLLEEDHPLKENLLHHQIMLLNLQLL